MRARQVRASRRLAALVAAVCVLLVAGPVRAEVRMQVALGWDGQSLIAERYTPVVATIDSGADALAALLVLEYVQDATQRVRLVQSVSTTPGRPVPVHVAVCLGGSATGLSVRLESPERGVLARAEYRLDPDASRGELPMLLLQPPRRVIVHIGEAAGLGEGVLGPLLRLAPREAAQRGTVSMLAEGHVPTIPAAFDSVDALVVKASDAARIDRRTLAVVRHHVAGGGRLVIMADGVADDWQRWLGEDAAVPIDTLDLPPGPVPDALVQALHARLAPPPPVEADDARDPLSVARRAAREARRKQNRQRAQAQSGVVVAGGPRSEGPGSPPAPEGVSAESAPSRPAPPAAPDAGPPPGASDETIVTYEPAQQVSRRAFTLRDAARAQGWVVRFAPGERPESGVLAVGPMGMGMVAVLGLPPARVAGTPHPRAAQAAWAEALAAVGIGGVEKPEEWSGASGAGASAARAYDAVLERLSDVPPVSHWVFIAIGACVVVLACLVGPVDFVVLRARGRLPRSWATFLLWVGVAGGAAYTLPLALRSGETRVHRLAVLDVLVPPGDAPPLAWQSAATAVWSGGTLTGHFVRTGAVASDAGAADVRGTWRGISPLDGASVSASITLPALDLGQRPAATGAAAGDAWSALMPGGEGDTAPLAMGHRQARWTLRALADEARVAPSMRVVPDADGRHRLVARGPDGGAATVRHAALRTSTGWIELRVEPGSGAFTHVLVAESAPAGEPAWLGAAAADGAGVPGMGLVFGAESQPFSVRRALDLPGPARRRLAAAARVDSGRWGELLVLLEEAEPDVAFRAAGGGGVVPVRQSVVLRAVVPLAAGAGGGVKGGGG